jgi:hypothetical protein
VRQRLDLTQEDIEGDCQKTERNNECDTSAHISSSVGFYEYMEGSNIGESETKSKYFNLKF